MSRGLCVSEVTTRRFDQTFQQRWIYRHFGRLHQGEFQDTPEATSTGVGTTEPVPLAGCARAHA